MGKLIGELAGFAMLFLIWILFLNMLGDFKVVSNGRIAAIRKVSVGIWGVGFFYILLGGFFYNISVGHSSIFQYDMIWGYGAYAEIMENVEAGSVGGIFRYGYLMIARFLGRVFFNQYLSATIYTSFLFAILYGIIIYDILTKSFEKEMADRILTLLFSVPFAYKLFLPSPASMICCLIALALWGILGRNKSIHPWKKQNRLSPWIYNLTLCLLVAVNTMFYYKEMLLRQ